MILRAARFLSVALGPLTIGFLTISAPPNGRAQNLSFGLQRARPVADWVNRLTIYEIWLKAFSPEGTLRGAQARLQHVADLGAGAVYLGPIARRSSIPRASPYNIADYNAIDPDYGTPEDLKNFVQEAHRLKLKVLLDIVYYHAAPDSVMAREPGFFVKTPDGKTARGFWPQPLPDYSNPKVREYLIRGLVGWVKDFDVDGFRCDVGGGVPLRFWEQARAALDRAKPDVILLSESDRPDDQLDAFDINYNFDGYTTLRSVMLDGEPAIRIREQWERMRRNMPQGARLLRFDDNQDWRRAVLLFGDKGSFVCSVLDFVLDGIPFLYNGQEIGDPSLTHWNDRAPIHWLDEPKSSISHDERRRTLENYQRLFRLRAAHSALTSQNLTWIDNSEPASVLSFWRTDANERILVILNLSNRAVDVTLDIPVMDSYVANNLFEGGQTWFPLYSGRVSAKLKAFDFLIGSVGPKQPLAQ